MAQSANPNLGLTAKDSFVYAALKKAGSEVVDFGEGLYHGAIESPINGAVQLTNHIAGTHVPELHLVDEERLSHSLGGILGNVAGTAIDVYAASVATGGIASAIGGPGMVGAALRFGAVGAAYTTVFQPTDANSDHFFRDRLTNGGIALGTFAAMGAGSALLDSAGLFAMAPVRSLTGNLTYGGAVGIMGGAAHAETSAILKDGDPIPKFSDFARDVGTFAAFGMAYGAADFTFNKFNPPTAKTFESKGANVTVFSDAQGQPVKVQGTLPSLNAGDARVGFESTKLTNGRWSENAWELNPNGTRSGFPAGAPAIDNVEVNGNKVTLTGDGVVREFESQGPYKRTVLEDEAREVARKTEYDRYHKNDTVGDKTATREYNRDNKLINLTTEGPGGPASKESAWLGYDKSGDLQHVSFSKGSQYTTSMSKQPDGSWQVNMNGQSHTWNGDVRLQPGGAGVPEQIQFVPKNGAATSFNVSDGANKVTDMLTATARYVPGATGRPILNVDTNGNATWTGGTKDTSFVNDQPVAAGQHVPIRPGDKIEVRVDVGDRYAVWENKLIQWTIGKSGVPVLGNQEIKPVTVDFDWNAK